MIDVTQLSKDIAISRELTIAYNERVLSGILSQSEYNKHVKNHRELATRVAAWRDATNRMYRAHAKWESEYD